MYHKYQPIRNLQEELEKALVDLRQENNKENIMKLIIVAGRTLQKGSGLPSALEFEQVLNKVYGKNVQ
jgi:hypothetical protein